MWIQAKAASKTTYTAVVRDDYTDWTGDLSWGLDQNRDYDTTSMFIMEEKENTSCR